MSALAFPQRHLGTLLELGSQLLEYRKPNSDHDPLARDLFLGFFDVCQRAGQDGLLAADAAQHPDLDPTDRTSLAVHATLRPALVAQLAAADLDGGGPRNARPRKLADAVLAALGVSLVEEADRSIALDASVRAQALAEVTRIVEPELALPHVRETIIARARALTDAAHLSSFDKLVAHLDERGQRLTKQPKVPIDALHAVQRALADARDGQIRDAATTAVHGVKEVIARADAAAAARIDEPITLRLTPRDVAILCAVDPKLPRITSAVAPAILDGLADAACLTWRAPEVVARPYNATQAFAVGEVIDHPKFGRGKVLTADRQRIDVEFADGKRALVHRPK
jgi:hypothetical protein